MKYFSIIGIILFIWLLSGIDISKTIQILSGVNLYYISISICVLLVTIYVRALKWRTIVNFFSKGYTTRQALVTYTIGVAFGAFTPGKAGDLIKVVDLKKVAGIDSKHGISISIFDKIADVIVLMSITLSCSILIALKFSTGLNNNLIIGILVLIMAGIIFSLTRYAKYVFGPFFKILPEKLGGKIMNLYSYFSGVIEIIKKDKERFFKFIFLTFLSWMLIFFTPYIFTKALHLEVPFLYFMIFIPVVFFVDALPISVLGVGSRDYALIYLFGLLNMTKEAMVSVSLLILLIGNIPFVALGFFFAWKNKYSLNIGSKDKDKAEKAEV